MQRTEPGAEPAQRSPMARRGRRHTLLRLSELRRWPVRDSSDQRTHWVDLAVDLAAGDYPPIRSVLVPGDGARLCALPWPSTNVADGTIRVPSIAAARPVAEDELAQMVLLRRDIQDALLLDVAGQRTVCANDLWLRDDPLGLVVAGADVSPWAVLRRLSRGLLGHGAERGLLDWRQIEFLRGDPRAAAAGRDYHRVILTLLAAPIAALMDALPYLHAAELALVLPDHLAAEVMAHVVPELQVQIMTELEPRQAAGILAEMAHDAAADLLGGLAIADATRLLEALPPAHSRALQALLRFPPDTAGGIMTNEVVTAPVALTVAAVNAHIKAQLTDPGFVYFVYLVDDEDARRLRGVVTLRDLHLADPHAPIEQVMQRALLTAAPLEPAREVAHRLADNSLNALPVVTPDQQLLGIVTVDAAMREILPNAWRDRLPRLFT